MHYWTEDRIRESYRRAEYPKQQISILAQLTDSDTHYIEAVCGLRPEATLVEKRKSKPKRQLNTALLDEMLQNISLTFRLIASKANCSESAVQKYYVANKHRLPIRRERTVRIDERILKYLRNSHLSIAQIVVMTGYSSSTVYRCYRKYRGTLPGRADGVEGVSNGTN